LGEMSKVARESYVFPRVGGLANGQFGKDVNSLISESNKGSIHGFMIPKVKSQECVEQIDDVLSTLEAKHKIQAFTYKALLVIDTPEAFSNMNNIFSKRCKIIKGVKSQHLGFTKILGYLRGLGKTRVVGAVFDPACITPEYLRNMVFDKNDSPEKKVMMTQLKAWQSHNLSEKDIDDHKRMFAIYCRGNKIVPIDEAYVSSGITVNPNLNIHRFLIKI